MLQSEFALEERKADIDLAAGPVSAEESRARAEIYRLLAGAFAEEPSLEWLAAFRRPECIRHMSDAGIRFDADFHEPGVAALREDLACEYATLFAASGGFPPVESVRLTGRYMQDPAYRTAETYQRAGCAVSRGRFEMFADHLGVELAFVAELLDRHAIAVTEGDATRRRELDKEIRRFWTLHLGRWVRGYGRLIERAANHSFYREMARFLVGFAEEEIVAMGLKRLDDLDQGREVVPKADIELEFDPNEPVCGACPSTAPDAYGGGPKTSPIRFQRLNDLRL
jgi:TorA maturation chaperone TorD